MGRLIDETGQRFERLVVIKQGPSISDKLNQRTAAQWWCQCDCGKEILVRGRSLRIGHTKSCGCYKLDIIQTRHKLPAGEAGFRMLCNSIRIGAEKRGYVCELSNETIRELSKQNCHYCGVEPKQKIGNVTFNEKYIYNGIDRMDNTKGYILGNVVPCCGRCNRAKDIMSYEEFKAWITQVHTNFCK